VLAAIESIGHPPVRRARPRGLPDPHDRPARARRVERVHCRARTRDRGAAFSTSHLILLGDRGEDPHRERKLLADWIERRVGAVLLASVDPGPELPPALAGGMFVEPPHDEQARERT